MSKQGHAAVLNPDQVDRHQALYQMRPRALDYALSPEQIQNFQRDGYLICRGLMCDGIEDLAQACDELRERDDLSDPHNLRSGELHEGKPWKFDPFHDLDLRFGALVRDRRICDALASIYQGREPRLFKDKLIMKPPGAHGNGLHQDYNWWQGFPDSLISVMIGIDPATKENGCTELFPRRENKFLTEVGVFGELSMDAVDKDGHVFIETEPGDVAFFHCYTPHQAGVNNSNEWRRQVFLTYNDSADGEHYQEHYEHYHWYITRWREEEAQQRAKFY